MDACKISRWEKWNDDWIARYVCDHPIDGQYQYYEGLGPCREECGITMGNKLLPLDVPTGTAILLIIGLMVGYLIVSSMLRALR